MSFFSSIQSYICGLKFVRELLIFIEFEKLLYYNFGQGGRINLDAQLDNFANTRHAIISAIGEDAAIKLFQNALFSIAIGSNDFINNYLTPVISKVEQHLVSPESFVAAMISRFRTQLMVTFFFYSKNGFIFYFDVHLLEHFFIT